MYLYDSFGIKTPKNPLINGTLKEATLTIAYLSKLPQLTTGCGYVVENIGSQLLFVKLLTNGERTPA